MNEHLIRAELSIQREGIVKSATKIMELLKELDGKSDASEEIEKCLRTLENVTDLVKNFNKDKAPSQESGDREINTQYFLDFLEFVNDARQVNGLKCYGVGDEEVETSTVALAKAKEAVRDVPVKVVESILEFNECKSTFTEEEKSEILNAAKDITSTYPKRDVKGLRSLTIANLPIVKTGDKFKDKMESALHDVMFLVRRFCPDMAKIGDYKSYFSFSSEPHIALAPIIAAVSRYLTSEEAKDFLYYCYTLGVENPDYLKLRNPKDLRKVEPKVLVELVVRFLKIFSNSDVGENQDKAWEDVVELSQNIYDADIEAATKAIDRFEQSYSVI